MSVEHNSKSILFILFVLIIISGSIYLVFDKYFIKRDFLIEAKIQCDPDYESCFTEACDIGDPRCVGTDGNLSFKIVTKRASEQTPLTECEFNHTCEVIYCNQENHALYTDSEICL